MSSPLSTSDVSVVMPVYGPPEGFQEAVASVLDQEPGELLIIDDASPRPLPNLKSEKVPITIRRLETNSGPAAARNAGIGLATRPWLAFLDSDDVWPAGSLRRQLDRLQESGADLVLGRATVVDVMGKEVPPENQPEFLPLMGCMVMATRLARDFPFEESLRYGEDSDFYSRIRASGATVHKHSELVLHYRQREGSLMDGRSGGQRREDFLNLVRTAARRRQQGRASED